MFAGIALIFNSCKKEYLVEATGIASGNVKDCFGVNLKAKVSIEGTNLSDSTDANGNYQIAGIPLGEHYLVVTKEGYTTFRIVIGIYEENTSVANTTSGKKQSYSLNAVQDARLNPLTAQLKGFVTYKGVPIANAKVYVYADVYKLNYYGAGYYYDNSNVFETTGTTGADGSYTLNNLPFGVEAEVVAYHPSSSNISGTTTCNLKTKSIATTINLDDDALFFVGSNISNGEAVDTTATITLTFSENISGAITASEGYVRIDRGGNEYVGANVTYNGNTITIKTINNLERYSNYDLEYYVYSSENEYIYGTISFHTIGRTVTLGTTAPTIGVTASLLTLTASVPGATGYRIYALDPDEIDYVFITTSSLNTSYNISGYQAGTKFYVIPYAYKDGVYTYGTMSNIVTKP